MTVNLGFFINKFLRLINRPALRNCQIDKTAKVGTGFQLYWRDNGAIQLYGEE